MHNYYFNMTTNELRTLRSKKYLRERFLHGKKLGYFDQQELKKIQQQLKWIDAAIESRTAQMRLIP